MFAMLHRVRQEVTHWTQASTNNHGNTVTLVLEEIIRDSEGIVVLTSESKLGAIQSAGEENESCFVVKASHIHACTVSFMCGHRKQGHAAHACHSLCSHTSSNTLSATHVAAVCCKPGCKLVHYGVLCCKGCT